MWQAMSPKARVREHWKLAEKIGFDTDVVMVDGDVEANERLEFEDSSQVYYNAVIQLVDETSGRI